MPIGAGMDRRDEVVRALQGPVGRRGAQQCPGAEVCDQCLAALVALFQMLGEEGGHHDGPGGLHGVLQKGRSSATSLLRLARVACGISLALGIRGYYRWVPSQWNMADGPSRGVGIGAADETKDAHRMRTTPKIVRPFLRAVGLRKWSDTRRTGT